MAFLTIARVWFWRFAGRACTICLLAFLVPRAVAANPTTPAAEYQLKAVFLFNFAQFAEWPERAFADARAPLVIGLLGEDPFGAYLEDLVKDEKIDTHPLQVRRFATVEDATACHILFISRSEATHLGNIVAQLKGRSILTISDADTFTRAGGMVRFVTDRGKIRLRINVEAAKACNLTISSKILRPATIVTAGKD